MRGSWVRLRAVGLQEVGGLTPTEAAEITGLPKKAVLSINPAQFGTLIPVRPEWRFDRRFWGLGLSRIEQRRRHGNGLRERGQGVHSVD